MKNSAIVRKLIQYIDKILGYTASADVKAFSEDTMMLEACVFCLSQMGELANILDDGFKERHPDVPWRSVTGLRHKIVHDYEGVKVLLIWDIIENDLVQLRAKLEMLGS